MFNYIHNYLNNQIINSSFHGLFVAVLFISFYLYAVTLNSFNQLPFLVLQQNPLFVKLLMLQASRHLFAICSN